MSKEVKEMGDGGAGAPGGPGDSPIGLTVGGAEGEGYGGWGDVSGPATSGEVSGPSPIAKIPAAPAPASTATAPTASKTTAKVSEAKAKVTRNVRRRLLLDDEEGAQNSPVYRRSILGR
jgi:hypothetical protein